MVLQLLMLIYIFVCMTDNAFTQFIRDDRGQFKVIAAAKGQTPKCASSTRQTYCEDTSDYPYELVLNAIRKSNIDVRRLLVDESTDDGPDLTFLNSGKYDSRTQKQRSLDLNNPITGNNFDHTLTDPIGNRLDLTTDRSLISRLPRPNSMVILDDGILTTNESQSRFKRQNLPSLYPGPPLCLFSSRYIYPKTAVSAGTGEWMYVVNAENMAQNLSQMVKVELCRQGVDGHPCMGVCAESNLPFGVISRCEQQYLQKRLLSLSASGEEIITSMFWLPTACLCKTFQSSF